MPHTPLAQRTPCVVSDRPLALCIPEPDSLVWQAKIARVCLDSFGAMPPRAQRATWPVEPAALDAALAAVLESDEAGSREAASRLMPAGGLTWGHVHDLLKRAKGCKNKRYAMHSWLFLLLGPSFIAPPTASDTSGALVKALERTLHPLEDGLKQGRARAIKIGATVVPSGALLCTAALRAAFGAGGPAPTSSPVGRGAQCKKSNPIRCSLASAPGTSWVARYSRFLSVVRRTEPFARPGGRALDLALDRLSHPLLGVAL